MGVFSPSYLVFAIARVITGIGIMGQTLTCFVMRMSFYLLPMILFEVSWSFTPRQASVSHLQKKQAPSQWCLMVFGESSRAKMVSHLKTALLHHSQTCHET